MKQKAQDILNKPILHYLILIVLIYFVVFFKLGSFSFRLWDESMFAVNAYEMEKNENYMVPYFDNEVDWRNSKPLLLTWIQVGFIKLFGFSELIMRLPSAIAVASSILMLFHFLRTKIDLLFAWIASLILLTSVGYIGLHTGRTGDTDALLSFFILATSIYFLKWLLEDKTKFVLISMVFFSLAVMTKSFAAFLFIVPLYSFGIFFLHTKFFNVLKSPEFYIGLTFFILSLILVFYVREVNQPGFLKSTLTNDVARLTIEMDTHAQGWDFYILSIFQDRFYVWAIPFFLGVIFCFQIKNPEFRLAAFFSLTIIFVYLISISFAKTKLYWYDMPMYPFLAAIAAIPIYLILNQISVKKHISISFALLFIFILPYRKMFYLAQSNAFSHGDKIEESSSIFLYDQLKNQEEENMTVYHYGYKGSVLCYQYMYADKGKEMRITYTPDFKSGEKVFVSNDSLKNYLTTNYTADTISVFENGIFVEIR